MKKNLKISISAILILITLLFFFIIFDFTKKQFDYTKIRKIIPQEYIAILEEKSTEFINFQFNVKKDLFSQHVEICSISKIIKYF